MKILIVEDDRNLSNAIKRCLSSTYDVDQAFDGAEGYFFAKEGIYDLVVLDLMLPEMDGYSVLEKLRKNEVFTPVLILTAKGTIADKARGFRTGADDYLVKPFAFSELLAPVRSVLRRGPRGNPRTPRSRKPRATIAAAARAPRHARGRAGWPTAAAARPTRRRRSRDCRTRRRGATARIRERA